MSRITGGESRQNELFKVIEKLRNTPIKTNENEEATNKITPTEKIYRQSTSKSIWELLESDTFKWERRATSKKSRSGTWTVRQAE